MIPILPDQVLKNRPADAALKRAYRLIRRLPLPGARAWLSFFPGDQPDFLLIDGNDRAFLISAIGLREPEAEEILQPGLFDLPESTRLKRNRILAAEQVLAGDFPGAPVRILLFPGIDSGILSRVKLQLGAGAHWIGGIQAREPQEFAAYLESLGARQLAPFSAVELRAQFSPEAQVPSAFVPKLAAAQYLQTNRDAQFGRDLLDFDQETWVKHDLMLDEASAVAAEGRSRLITGVAGSGKSLALLYRGRLLAGLGQHRQMLFITHNKPLIADLEWRFAHLSHLLPLAPGTRVEFRHFFRWLGQLDPRQGRDGLDLIYDQERIETIRRLAVEMFPDSPWPGSFLVDEIALIADQVDDSELAYLKLDRAGRGVPLGPAQRRSVHKLYRRYRNLLANERKQDWYTLVRILWERISNGQVALPRYDLILIDEGQFFAPVWFAILKRCLAPKGEIIVAADPTQGFLKRRQSWSSVGLEVRGRSARLEKSYRNTPALQKFARRFYLSRSPHEDGEEVNLPSLQQDGGRDGATPGLVRHPTPQDACAWAAAEVAAILAGGVPAGAILIIHADSRQLGLLADSIPQASVLDHQDPARQRVAITTLNAATGIERPIVILLGIDRLFEGEGDPRLTLAEKDELVRDNTRKVYMAITRAGERLLISYAGERVRQILCGDVEVERDRAAPSR